MTGFESARWSADGGGEGPIVTFVPTTALIVAGLIVLLVVAVALIGLAWWVIRRVRRSPLLQRGLLEAQAAALPAGPHREIAVMRRDLSAHLAQTRRMLAIAPADTPEVALLAEMLPRLERAAVALDDQLRLLQTEPDPNLLSSAMPALQRRVTDLTANATRLREIALRLLGDRDQFQRSLLNQDLRDGVAGLEAGLDEIAALQRRLGLGQG
jgi:hypothetical protein